MLCGEAAPLEQLLVLPLKRLFLKLQDRSCESAAAVTALLLLEQLDEPLI